MLRLFKQYYPIRNLFFIAGEGLFIFLSILAAEFILSGARVTLDSWLFIRLFAITTICIMCLYYNDLYDFNVIDKASEMLIRLLQAFGVTAILLAGFYVYFPQMTIETNVFALSVAIMLVVISSWRFGYSIVLKKDLFTRRIAILGSGDMAFDIFSEIRETKDCGYSIASIIVPNDEEESRVQGWRAKAKKLEDYKGLSKTVRDMGVEMIIVAIKDKRGGFPSKELLKCRVDGIDILEGISFYEMLTGKLKVEQIKPAWFIFSDGFKKPIFRSLMKRTEDIVFSIVMIVVLSPLILLTMLLVKLDSKGPVFFSQERVGRRRKPYRMYKFRSMVTDAEAKTGPVWARTNDDRVTRVGRFIRKCRIDELPQLWNILKGDMSLVGPRPEREFFVRELEEKIPYYSERFNVKPGLTGWAQVSYDYGATVEDAVAKLDYELFYIKNFSILLDLVIIFRTVKTVIFGKGAR